MPSNVAAAMRWDEPGCFIFIIFPSLGFEDFQWANGFSLVPVNQTEPPHVINVLDGPFVKQDFLARPPNIAVFAFLVDKPRFF